MLNSLKQFERFLKKKTNFFQIWDASGLIPEKQGGPTKDTGKPKPRTKKNFNDEDLTFSVKNQKMVIENEEPPSPKSRNSKMENEDHDHDFFKQYTRQKPHNYNTRMSDFDEP